MKKAIVSLFLFVAVLAACPNAAGAASPEDIVSLAERDTIQILNTDYLTRTEEVAVQDEKPSLSGSFWAILSGIGFLAAAGGAIGVYSGRLHRSSLGVKLYASHGALAVLAVLLGVLAYQYIGRTIAVADLSSRLQELDAMSSELSTAQLNFEHYALENAQYGQRQIADIQSLITEYADDSAAIRQSPFFNEEDRDVLKKMEALVAEYKMLLPQMTAAHGAIASAIGSIDAQEAEMRGNMNDLSRRYAGDTGLKIKEVELLFTRVLNERSRFLLDRKADRVNVMESDLRSLQGTVKDLSGRIDAPQDRALVAEIEADVNSYSKHLSAIVKQMAVQRETSFAMKSRIARVKAYTASFAAVAAVKMTGMDREARLLATLLTLMAAAIGGTLAFRITRAIAGPINRHIETLHEANAVMRQAVAQISEASQLLAQGAAEQAAALEETNSSIEQISAMAHQNSENTVNAKALMDEDSASVEMGMSAMREMVAAMDLIRKSSDEISHIIKVIEEIAFQTNLLALNAAVEAARAGEHGKGFAVVAEEVRNLAQRSATASKDTAVLIEKAVATANEGGVIVAKAVAHFETIAGSTGKLDGLVGSISQATTEQSQSLDQVTQAVSAMDQVTQKNAATAEETASASEELYGQAEGITAIVSELDGLIHGASAPAAETAGPMEPAPALTEPENTPRLRLVNGRMFQRHAA